MKWYRAELFVNNWEMVILGYFPTRGWAEWTCKTAAAHFAAASYGPEVLGWNVSEV